MTELPAIRRAVHMLTAEEIDALEDQAGAITATEILIPLSQIHPLAHTAALLMTLATVDPARDCCPGCCEACGAMRYLAQVSPFSDLCPYHQGHQDGYQEAEEHARLDGKAAGQAPPDTKPTPD